MTISTYSRTERRGIAGRIQHWLGERPASETGGLDELNDHLLRDIGVQPCPTEATIGT